MQGIARSLSIFIAPLLAALAVSGAWAQQFTVAVGPPRLELRADSGDVIRESVTLQNFGLLPSSYSVYTSEWTIDDQGQQRFTRDLIDGSCRPWVRIERREVTVLGRARRPFRMEIQVPPDAPRGQCRFALMFEGVDPLNGPTLQNGMALPMTGRLGVIVYLSLNGARPSLSLVGMQRSADNGKLQLHIENSGDAHGRLDGYLGGRDADGNPIEARISTLPILPKTRRRLELHLFKPNSDERIDSPAWPLAITGDILWDGGTLQVDEVAEAP